MLIEIPDEMVDVAKGIYLSHGEDGYNWLSEEQTAALEHIIQQCRKPREPRSENSIVVTISDPTGEVLAFQLTIKGRGSNLPGPTGSNKGEEKWPPDDPADLGLSASDFS